MVACCKDNSANAEIIKETNQTTINWAKNAACLLNC